MSNFIRTILYGSVYILAILTQIIFLILKLVEIINWEWLIVCIPAISLGGLLIIFLVLGFFAMMRYSRDYIDL